MIPVVYRRTSISLPFLVGCMALSSVIPVPAQLSRAQKAVFYENRVRPILAEHCYSCHSDSAGERKGGLVLDRRAGWMRGGDYGKVIVPGKPEASKLIKAVQHHGKLKMPKDAPKLNEERIAWLTKWIRMGAPGPDKERPLSETTQLGDQDLLTQQARSHWSFQPVHKPKPPPGYDHPVDAFIRDRLKREGLSPASPADARTLLRRLSFDLIGLPPSFEEVRQFDPATAVKKIRSLLDSPHFGERWGRHWLDIARYADTREWQAAGLDSRYPFAFTYRDYVIDAFNTDKPVDQFIREQLAADHLAEQEDAPELAALGFLTVGARYRNNVPEIINDRIDVVTRGLMGLTVSCARCHDHKFDPVPTTDYYALYGVFRSCVDPASYPEIDSSREIPVAHVADYEEKRAAAEKKLSDYTAGLARDAMQDFRAKPEAYMGALYEMAIAENKAVRQLITGGKFKETALTPLANSLTLIPKRPQLKKHPVLGPLAILISQPEAKFEADLTMMLAKPAGMHPRVRKHLQRARPTSRKALLQAYGKLFAEVLAESKSNRLTPADKPVLNLLYEPESPFYITPRAAETASRLLGKGRTALAKLKNPLNDLDAEHPGAPFRAMVLNDAPRPVKGVVFERGDPNRKGATVDRRFLTLFGGELLEGGSGRLALARAIASPDNPLTARVYVNRVWQHLLGTSLVDTPGDYGLQAPEPIHLDLLNWLTAAFIEDGWSTKKLIARIVSSQTYQQSNQPRGNSAETDPENRLYARANVRRMDFEAMRDAMLVVAGNLDRQIGGRPIDITTPPYSTRRTVYAYIDRMNLDDVFSTFDFPSPTQTAATRPETLVPQQALYSMNDPFTLEQARVMVRDVIGTSKQNGVTRLTAMYRRALQRDPTPAELKAGLAFLQDAVEQRNEMLPDWQYGYHNATGNASIDQGFTAFKFFDPKRKSYQPSRSFPHPKLGHMMLTAVGGHPGTGDRAVVRRWRAPYAGAFNVNGELLHASEKGDGVLAVIRHSSRGELGQWEAFHGAQQIHLKTVNCEAGDFLDFMVYSGETTMADSFRWTPSIRLQGEAESAPVDSKSVWIAQSDFAPPGSPTLSPWQQVAHALMMTNEFLFID